MSHLIWYPGHELLVADIVRAVNCHLYDRDGRRYVDFESGVWCTSIGHGHERIVRTITEQVQRMGHAGFNYSAAVVEEAAQTMLAVLGLDGGRCVFLCSGSEAVEYGVGVAQSVIGRSRLMTMTDSYFGAYGSAARQHADEWFAFDWTPCATCPHAEECDEHCMHWASIPLEDIGGFLLEPGSSSGLVRFPPDKLIRNIVGTIRQRGGLVLVNEVTTGVGRTGRWFGHQHYDFVPDIAALGKGIGNGYPVAVAAFAPAVIQRLGGEEVKYAQSHQNDPLGAAVAQEVVRTIEEEGLIERGRAIATVLTDGLEMIAQRTGAIREVRARGLMVGLELVDGEGTPFTIRVHHELVRRGYLVGRRSGHSVLRIDPALTIDREDIDGFLAALEAVLEEGCDTQERSPSVMTEQAESPWSGSYKIPWDVPAFSRRMLREHLTQKHDLASRRREWIMKQVQWIHRDMLGGKPARVLDLCCGPGFYAHRLAARGHQCLGIDFSPASLEHARRNIPDGSRCAFELGDVREADFGGPWDLVMLLYGELNVFAPDEIASILGRVRSCLAPQGRLMIEPQTFEVIESVGKAERSEQEHEEGLFSDRPHRCVTENQWLAEEKIAIQTFTVTDAADGETRVYRNTTKAWSDDELRELIEAAGFRDVSRCDDWPCNTDALALWTARTE